MRGNARWLAAVAAATAMACNAQVTEPQPAPVAWRCWHSAEHASSISCRVVTADAVATPEQTEFPQRTSTFYAIRTAPETLEGELVLIPLYGPPVDWERVARLARVVVCGQRADCSMEFSRLPPG